MLFTKIVLLTPSFMMYFLPLKLSFSIDLLALNVKKWDNSRRKVREQFHILAIFLRHVITYRSCHIISKMLRHNFSLQNKKKVLKSRKENEREKFVLFRSFCEYFPVTCARHQKKATAKRKFRVYAINNFPNNFPANIIQTTLEWIFIIFYLIISHYTHLSYGICFAIYFHLSAFEKA